MIKVAQEKASKLSAAEINYILTVSFDMASTNGFVNSFVFERAMYVYTYAVLCAKNGKEDELEKKAAENEGGVLDLWNHLLLDGSIEELTKNYEPELTILQHAAGDMFDDYQEYQRSIRCIANDLTGTAESIIREVASAAKSSLSKEQYQEVVDIASKWGLKEVIAGA